MSNDHMIAGNWSRPPVDVHLSLVELMQHVVWRSGGIPLRQLVYRVQALPQSLVPLVWDFGQLDKDTEHLYIREMVHRAVSTSTGYTTDGAPGGEY